MTSFLFLVYAFNSVLLMHCRRPESETIKEETGATLKSCWKFFVRFSFLAKADEDKKRAIKNVKNYFTDMFVYESLLAKRLSTLMAQLHRHEMRRKRHQRSK